MLPAAPARCPRPSQRGPERARRSHSPLLPRPRLTRLSRHPEPTKAAPRPDACLLPARLPSPDFGVSSTLGFGTRSPWSGGRAAAIGKQQRRPVAGACPSPHPAGNLGGALGVSVCAAAPAGWGKRAHGAAGRRRERGRGGGAGPGASLQPPRHPGCYGLPGRPGFPGPGPQAAVPEEAAAIPLDGSGDLCLRTGARGRRGSRGKRAGECLALCRGELAAGPGAAAGATPCPKPMPALPLPP